MVFKCAAAILLAAVLAAADAGDVPPVSLVQENVHKASAIVKGKIVRSEAIQRGVTVAHLRVSRSYRGSFRAGDEVSFASFKENDRYPERFLREEVVVFLTKRKAGSTPPEWETATDLSEFISTTKLETMVSKQLRRKHR